MLNLTLKDHWFTLSESILRVNLSALRACYLFRSLSEKPFQHTALPGAHKHQRSQVSIHESRAWCSPAHLAGFSWHGMDLLHVPPELWDIDPSVLSRRDTSVSSHVVGSGLLPTALRRRQGFSQFSLPPALLPGSFQYKPDHPDPPG